MTLQELFENAHLDALGMLDPAEQAAFEKAYAAASPSVKAQLRAEQARWAAQQVLLPEVEPSENLKSRVLAAVAEAQLAPVVGQEDDALSFSTARRVSRWWRVSSIGLATAAVALLMAFLYVGQTNERLRDDLSRGGFDDSIRLALGRGDEASTHLRDLLLAPDVKRAAFVRSALAESTGFAGQMTVLSRDSWTQARIAMVLPQASPGRQYCLVEVSQDGSEAERTLQTFDSNGLLQSVTVGALEQGTKLALVTIGADGRVDLKGALLTITI